MVICWHDGSPQAGVTALLKHGGDLQCRLGRRILRPLLRSELGEVANRRAWFDVTKLTPEVLQLYKQPLKVQGWDLALVQVVPATWFSGVGNHVKGV